MARPERVGPFQGSYHPGYRLTFWNGGDPRLKVKGVDLRSVIAIQTSKSLEDVAGTFTITLKDARARHLIQEMDVVRIELRGHDSRGLTTVWRGVVDTCRAGGSADVFASREDTVIEGRCMAKYLQITSLFLPVWDPQSLLPTALIFGLGDSSKKVGGNSPYDIFQYIIKRFTFGLRNFAGVSGVPNSRFWIEPKTRFAKVPFIVPFLQFDEDTVADALKAMEILGYTEAWVDEVGRIVYRHPQWDAPASYTIPTQSLKDWDLPRTDVGVATYIEVIPAGDPGIDSATAQALRAGRAPVPSSYLSGLPDSASLPVKKEFVIDTDSKGRVTAKGKKNFWYRRQRRLGLRPQQITEPLLFTQEQAQAMAEGLLQFYGRMIKSGTIVTPGYPGAHLGTTLRLVGPLDGGKIDRAYYVDGVQHEYVEGDHYDTTWTLSHGRDPWDPKWGTITIPKFDPAQLSAEPGVLAPGGPGVNMPAGTAPFVPQGEKFTWGRIDSGLDGDLAKPGGPLIAVGDGVVHHEGPDPGGFGNSYPRLDLASPLGGKIDAIYYGHCTPTVSDGAHVKQGDVICKTHTSSGDGNGGAGHFEIGPWPIHSGETGGEVLAPYMNYPHGHDPKYP